MQAWQFVDTHQPLKLAEVPKPTAEAGEVILEIRAAGLCHSDVGAMEDPGWLNFITKRPVVFGHEIAGVVCEVGAGVTEFEVGDRVGVCPTARIGVGAPGYVRDGGFTYFHRAIPTDLVKMPDGLSFELAALGTDAGMTSYHGIVTKGGLKAGMKVGVIGLGGLGQIGARVGVVLGAEVHVCEKNEAVWPMAKEIGAKSVVGDVSEWKDQDFDLIIDYAGFGTTTAGAVNAIRRGGRVVLVGMGVLEFTLSTVAMIRKQAQVVGSSGGTREDVAAVYQLLADGKITPVVTVIGFDGIPKGLEDLRDGKVKGRLVARIEH